MLIPDLAWQISRHFSELEGRRFTNGKLKGQRLDMLQQDILFRLDQSGVALQSETKMMVLSIPSHYIVDRPFLVYMKKRGARSPYFAMWVDNAELLTHWQRTATSRDRQPKK